MNTNDKGRPMREAAPTMSNGDRAILPQTVRVSATVTLTLDHQTPGYWQELDREDRWALDSLSRIPDGARLIVEVKARELLTDSAVAWLRDHAHRLNIEVAASTPEAARRWYDGIVHGAVAA